MSFRRNSEGARKWNTWLREHRDEVLACGVPALLLEDESSWFYFLEHGYFQPSGMAEPIIDIARIPRGAAERLCRFLERDEYYPASVTLRDLQSRLKREMA